MHVTSWLDSLRDGILSSAARRVRRRHVATSDSGALVKVAWLEPRLLLSAAGSEEPLPPGSLSEAKVADAVASLTTTGRTDEFGYLTGEIVETPEFFGIQTAQSGPVINIDDFRADPRFAGINGGGFSVVVLDTGVDLDHPFFGPDLDMNGVADRIVFSYDFSGTDDPDASDTNGHGTNVSSIAVSSDPTHTGMAPGANLIHLKVFPDGANPGASFADMEQALQWVVANANTYKIVSVNMSIGSQNVGYFTQSIPLSDEYAALANLDIIVAVSSGNSFFSFSSVQGVNRLSADASVISVGATYDANIGGPINYSSGAIAHTTGTDHITPFTQRDEYLLDVLAPGASITGAYLNGGTVSYHGTSQASPHIAGIAALAQQLAVQELGRRLTLDEFETLLRSTASLQNDGDNENDNVTNTGLNFPRVDVFALGEAILDMRPGTISGTVFQDLNGDGNNAGDPPLAGVTIYLDSNNSGMLDQGVDTFTNNTSLTLPDLDIRRSSLNVSGLAGYITDVNVQLNISHTWVEDLEVHLISPSGTRIQLFRAIGGSGDNFSNTIFDDEATTPITAAAPPYAGTFQPQEMLAALDGEDPNGLWQLELSDAFSGDAGTLSSWSLQIESAEFETTSGLDGSFEFLGLAAGSYIVRQIPPLDTSPTTPVGGAHPVSLSPDQDVSGLLFGNMSNSPAGITITETGLGTSVSEHGSVAQKTDTFDVVLTFAPTTNVVLNITSNDTTEATVNVATLTFTPGNWNVAQTVTVSGVFDNLIDGNQNTTITVSVDDAQSDDAYDGGADQNVAVAVADVANRPVVVGPIGAGQLNPVTIQWNGDDVVGETSFALWLINKTTGALVYENSALAADSTSFELPLTLDPGEYRFWLNSVSANGYSQSGLHTDFTVGPTVTPPPAPTGFSLSAGPTVEWGEVSEATSYNIYLINLATGTLAASQTGHHTNSYNVAFLADGQYRIWVKASNQAGTSGWSTPFDFTVGTPLSPPAAPTGFSLTNPETTTPTINWGSVPQAATYSIYFIRLADNAVISGATGLTDPNFTPGAALSPGMHRIWVKAHNVAGSSSWSTPYDFTIGTPIVPPTAPTGFSVLNANTANPTVTWESQGAGVTYSIWFINLDTGAVVSGATGLTTNSFTASGLTTNRYRIWVKAHNAAGSSSWSSPFDFDVAVV
jgi:subtilisin-like proprotein convertase family protein